MVSMYLCAMKAIAKHVIIIGANINPAIKPIGNSVTFSPRYKEIHRIAHRPIFLFLSSQLHH